MWGWLRGLRQRRQSMTRVTQQHTDRLREASQNNTEAARLTQSAIQNRSRASDSLREVLAATLERLPEGRRR